MSFLRGVFLTTFKCLISILMTMMQLGMIEIREKG